MSLFAELKRRNVFRVSAAYLALGWVITQVTATVVPVLNLPAQIAPMVVWIGVIGFPIVVVFSWVYELTPEGLKREREVARDESITHRTAKRLDLITIVLVVVAILFVVADRFVPHAAAPVGATGTSPNESDSASRASALPQQEVSPAQAAAPDDKSIAVLPFLNMSEDAGNEFFAEGVSEELLNLLAKIPELRVIARTSSFSFKGKDVDVATIAKTLRVAHVLEGSVRKAGDRVRITAQLVRASDSSHLWSETYDRKLDDVFAVQGEIAGVVVAQLKLTLLGAPPQAKQVDGAAYALFLQARQAGRLITPEGLAQSIELYQQALKIDPTYAAAWAGLGRSYLNQSQSNLRPAEEAARLAREALNRALQADPNYAFSYALLARIAQDHDNDLAGAAKLFERALALEPANPDVLGNAAALADALNRPDLALALETPAIELDPLNPIRHSNIGFSFLQAERPEQAIASFRTGLALSPGYIGIRSVMAMTLLRTGHGEEALATAQQEPAPPLRLMSVAMIQYTLGHRPESDAALAELIQKYAEQFPAQIAAVQAWRGAVDSAFEWLDKAKTSNAVGLRDITGAPMFDSIHGDARWLPFLRRIGRAPEQLAAVQFDVKLPAPARAPQGSEPAP